MSDEDYIALLIGRIVMSWGLIDEGIWSEIVRFELHKRPGTFPHELKIAGSWNGRVKCWRQLCASICQGDQIKLSAVDRVITKMNKDIIVRHHLAHGYALLFKIGRRGVRTKRPNLHIHQHRETTKRLLANQEAFKRDPKMEFWAEDLHPMYTIEELEEHIENVAKIKAEFESASYGVLPRSIGPLHREGKP